MPQERQDDSLMAVRRLRRAYFDFGSFVKQCAARFSQIKLVPWSASTPLKVAIQCTFLLGIEIVTVVHLTAFLMIDVKVLWDAWNGDYKTTAKAVWQMYLIAIYCTWGVFRVHRCIARYLRKDVKSTLGWSDGGSGDC